MANIQKTYIYKIYRNGTYIGNLPQPSSDFNYSQDINSAGSQITITIPLTADISDQSPPYLSTEDGKILTAEDGTTYLTADQQPDIIGNSGNNILIRNNNDIKVYEISSTYPNGKLMFVGYISSWESNFGGDDDDQITITCLSNGTELSNYLVPGGTASVLDQSQATQNDFIDVVDYPGAYIRLAQTFTTGSGVTSLSAIALYCSVASSPQPITVSVYANKDDFWRGVTPLGTVTRTINNTTAAEILFTFLTPITVTANTQYAFVVQSFSTVLNTNIYFSDTFSVYAGGEAWFSSSGTFPGFWHYLGYTGGGASNHLSLYFKTYTDTFTTVNTFTDQDPSNILKTILDSYISQGGQLLEDTYGLTGISATITFNVNTILEGIQNLLTLSPSGWYWSVDVASQVIHFKQVATTPTYVLTKGKHLTSLRLKATIEQLKNVGYFSGGDTGGGVNLFVRYADASAIADNNGRIGLDRLSNSNVKDASTGTLIAQNDINNNNTEIYQTQVTILDQAMDITLPQVGETIGFNGFGTFIDNLVLQIVRKQYTPEKLTLGLGKIPPRTNLDIQQLKNNVLTLQTLANPTSPS